MEAKHGKLYISHSEVIHIANRYCNGAPELRKCNYDSDSDDFRECNAYKLFSSLDDDFKERGDEIVNSFNTSSVLCPVFNGYGRARSKLEKQFQLVQIATPDAKIDEDLELTDAMFNMRARFYDESKKFHMGEH